MGDKHFFKEVIPRNYDEEFSNVKETNTQVITGQNITIQSEMPFITGQNNLAVGYGSSFGATSGNITLGMGNLTFSPLPQNLTMTSPSTFIYEKDTDKFDIIHMIFSFKEQLEVLENENKKLKDTVEDLNKRLLRVEYQPFGVECMAILEEEKNEGVAISN